MSKHVARNLIDLVCPVCKTKYQKEEYEHRRNQKKGRASVCSRSCLATLMNTSAKKLEQTREMLAERNANQWREDNANWKGGRSKRLKPLPGAQESKQ